MGSRYGGLKQMDVFGPNGQTIIDFSIYDAILAGFGEIVFVIRKSFAEEFIAQLNRKWAEKIALKFVYQETEYLPDIDIDLAERTKPWGTAHAVWVAKNHMNAAFGVINADDFYGREAMRVLQKELVNESGYSLIAYPIKDTLSENGTVNRGVCSVNEAGFLTGIKECKNIQRFPKIAFVENGTEVELLDSTLVSMNMWALRPDFFHWAETYFVDFLMRKGNETGSEFYIPDVIQRLMQEEHKVIRVVPSGSKWYGVTYQDDKPMVREAFSQMLAMGLYPGL